MERTIIAIIVGRTYGFRKKGNKVRVMKRLIIPLIIDIITSLRKKIINEEEE